MNQIYVYGMPVLSKARVSQRVEGFGKKAFVISVGRGGHWTWIRGPVYSRNFGAASSVCCSNRRMRVDSVVGLCIRGIKA